MQESSFTLSFKDRHKFQTVFDYGKSPRFTKYKEKIFDYSVNIEEKKISYDNTMNQNVPNIQTYIVLSIEYNFILFS